MVRGLGRVTAMAMVMAAALVIPLTLVATSDPAGADTVIDGCTVVSNPTATNFSNCPNANFSGANLLGVNLDYANLTGSNFSGAQLAECVFVPPPTPGIFSCSNTTFEHAALAHATLSGATATSCASARSTPTLTSTGCTGVDLANADLESANVSNANLSAASLSSADLVGANVSGATYVASFSLALGGPLQYFGTDFTDADLAGLNLSGSDLSPTTLTGANLTGAQLENANLASITELDTTFGGQLGQSNLTNANLTGANLSGTTLTGATLTGATFTGTILIPSNQSVTATSQAGAMVTWATPAAIPGATPGNCTPPSGSTFPLFASTVTCQVLDANGDVATGTFQVTVQPTTQYFTRVLLPNPGATLTGQSVLDAGASDAPGVTKVQFELSGGSLSDQVIVTAGPTIYGWLAQWNSATVPNGTYSLQSVATDAANHSDTSAPVSVVVSNVPATTVLIPSNGAALSGSTLLDASASNATSVEFLLFGGSYGYNAPVLCTATPTIYGWLCAWNTLTVPNGSYFLVSEALNAAGSAFSPGVGITTNNPAVSFAGSSVFTYPSESIALTLSAASTNTVTVDFTTQGGPSSQLFWGAWTGAASSFSPSSGTVTFAPGQTNTTLSLSVNPTTVTGCDSTTPCYPSVTINLTNPTNAVLGSTPSTNVFYAPT
jgi:uncharacterized protein YjbI with pentapeptide repeats